MTRRSAPLPLRLLRTSTGGFLVVMGLIGLFVPVMPGWLLIIPGLALLAREFVWARRLLDRARKQLEWARRRDLSESKRSQQRAA